MPLPYPKSKTLVLHPKALYWRGLFALEKPLQTVGLLKIMLYK
jgi:hypothetical protein